MNIHIIFKCRKVYLSGFCYFSPCLRKLLTTLRGSTFSPLFSSRSLSFKNLKFLDQLAFIFCILHGIERDLILRLLVWITMTPALLSLGCNFPLICKSPSCHDPGRMALSLTTFPCVWGWTLYVLVFSFLHFDNIGY